MQITKDSWTIEMAYQVRILATKLTSEFDLWNPYGERRKLYPGSCRHTSILMMCMLLYSHKTHIQINKIIKKLTNL